MPVEFLTDDEAGAYGRYAGTPSQADLDRVFFLDDDDLKLVRRHCGEHMRAGFALQLATVRWLGKFLEDPLDVPDGVLEFVAGKQLGMADPSEVKRYTERGHTRFDHQWEIKKERGYREFDDAEEEFAQWAAARSRATGDGPKSIFTDGVAWLRQRNILLPGVTTLARLVASVRDETTRQLLEELAALPDPVQRRALDRLLEVPPGSRLSDLERWRKGPAPRGSGPSLVKSLDRVAEISGVGLARLGAEGRVPPRRMAELCERAGGDLLGEDPGDARGPQRVGLGVGLGVERLADGGGAGVPDPHVPRRHRACRRGPGQLGPGRTRPADRRDRDAEGLREIGHEPEPGGVILGGHPALSRPARRAGRGRAGRHRAAVRLDAQEVVIAHPQIVSWGCVIRPAVCNNP
jgi:hypothetical protein